MDKSRNNAKDKILLISNDTGVMSLMKFFLFALVVMATNAVYASMPLPVKKPTENSFESILENAVKKEQTKIPRPPELAPNLSKVSIIVPPPLPSQKKQTQATNEMVQMVDGIPLPNRKPLAIKTTNVPTIQLPSQQKKTVIQYSGNNDERTASRRTGSGIERRQAKKRESIRETSEKSPFKTAKLPRAGKKSTRDPVIIFFQEGSSELEVGQIDIIKSDILNVLRRSSARKVAVYGYAERNRSNPDKTTQLSLSRALLISEYLAENRINPNRIEARSTGNDTPISPKNRVDVIIY